VIKVWKLNGYLRLGKCRRIGRKCELGCVSLDAKKKRSNSALTDSGGSQTDVQILLDHRGFGGGGFGFGTPVVSYAPRPMLQCVASLVIMLDAEERSMSG
jgi:hypothetical protein